MIREETYAALLDLQRERGSPTMSKTVGEALREWAEARSSAGFKPDAVRNHTAATAGRGAGLKPMDARLVTIERWSEVRGLVREVLEDGTHLRVALEDGGDLIAVVLPGPPHGPLMQVGMTVAILRTDEAGREYVVRSLD